MPAALGTRGALGRALRRGLLNRRLHRVLGPRAQRMLMRAAYLGRFSEWIDEQELAPGFESRFALYAHLLASERLDAPIHYLEFGVFHGTSIRWWSEQVKDPNARFVGFDTFVGLPEAWAGLSQGALTTRGQLPQIDDPRVSFEAGLFQDTLPGFLDRQRLDGRLVVNLDPDLYSSTLYVLTMLAPQLRPGDLLIFDEMGSVREPVTEFRAFLDFASAYRVGYRALAASPVYKVVAIRLETAPVTRAPQALAAQAEAGA
jgi:hypothetical protein